MGMGMEMHQGLDQAQSEQQVQSFCLTPGTEVVNNMRTIEGKSLQEAHNEEVEAIKNARGGDAIYITVSGSTGSGKSSLLLGKEVLFREDPTISVALEAKGLELQQFPFQLVMASQACRLEEVGIIKPEKKKEETNEEKDESRKQGTFIPETYSEITQFGIQELAEHREAQRGTNKVTVYLVETGSPNGVPAENAEVGTVPKIDGDDRFIGIPAALANNPEARRNLFIYLLEGSGDVKQDSLARRMDLINTHAIAKEAFAKGEKESPFYDKFIKTFFKSDMNLMFSLRLRNESGVEQEEVIQSEDLVRMDIQTLLNFGDFFLGTMNTPEGMKNSDESLKQNMERHNVTTQIQLLELIADRLGYTGEEKEKHVRIVRNPKLIGKSKEVSNEPSEMEQPEEKVDIRTTIDLNYFDQTLLAKKYPQIVQKFRDTKKAIYESLVRDKYPGFELIL